MIEAISLLINFTLYFYCHPQFYLALCSKAQKFWLIKSLTRSKSNQFFFGFHHHFTAEFHFDETHFKIIL